LGSTPSGFGGERVTRRRTRLCGRRVSGHRSLRWVRAAVVVAIVGVPCAGLADTASESDAHIQLGVVLRRAGKNVEALAEFEKAYALAATPRARVQVALARQALGDWLGAEPGLEEGLQTADDPWITQYRLVLEGALATVRGHLARLFVAVDTAQGELLVNGVSVGALPIPAGIRVVAGNLDIEVRAPGCAPARRAIRVEPGAELRETFHLEPLVPAAALPPSLAPREDGPPLRAPSSRGARSTAAYVTLGAAGALGIAAAVAWRVRDDNVAIYNDDGRCLVGIRTRGQQCGAFATTAEVALGIEIGAAASAVAAAGVGAWLLLTPGRRPSGAGTVACGPWAPFAVSCGGRF
jgi:hypothetical protein